MQLGSVPTANIDVVFVKRYACLKGQKVGKWRKRVDQKQQDFIITAYIGEFINTLTNATYCKLTPPILISSFNLFREIVQHRGRSSRGDLQCDWGTIPQHFGCYRIPLTGANN